VLNKVIFTALFLLSVSFLDSDARTMPKRKGLNLLGDYRLWRVGLVKKGETLDQKVEQRQLQNLLET